MKIDLTNNEIYQKNIMNRYLSFKGYEVITYDNIPKNSNTNDVDFFERSERNEDLSDFEKNTLVSERGKKTIDNSIAGVKVSEIESSDIEKESEEMKEERNPAAKENILIKQPEEGDIKYVKNKKPVGIVLTAKIKPWYKSITDEKRYGLNMSDIRSNYEKFKEYYGEENIDEKLNEQIKKEVVSFQIMNTPKYREYIDNLIILASLIEGERCKDPNYIYIKTEDYCYSDLEESKKSLLNYTKLPKELLEVKPETLLEGKYTAFYEKHGINIEKEGEFVIVDDHTAKGEIKGKYKLNNVEKVDEIEVPQNGYISGNFVIIDDKSDSKDEGKTLKEISDRISIKYEIKDNKGLDPYSEKERRKKFVDFIPNEMRKEIADNIAQNIISNALFI